MKELLPTEDHVITIVGAGGKTSLMFYLARTLPGLNLTTTTTKVGYWQTQEADLRGSFTDFCADTQKYKAEKVSWVSPDFPHEKGKLSGFDLETFSTFAQQAKAQGFRVILEGDGAKFKHIKAPAAHEPVVPSESNVILCLTGLDVLGQPVCEEIVHRSEIFTRINHCSMGDIIDPEMIVRNFCHPQGGFKNCPVNCRKIAVLNQADDEEKIRSGRVIAEMLLKQGISEAWITHLKVGEEMVEVCK